MRKRAEAKTAVYEGDEGRLGLWIIALCLILAVYIAIIV